VKFYLAGPMTGEPLWGFQAFEDAYWHLRRSHPDWDVVSPHNIDIETGRVHTTCRPHGGNNPQRVFTDVQLSDKFDWNETLLLDMKEILDCDGIVLLAGWHKSKGASYELVTAAMAGKTIYDYAYGAVLAWQPWRVERLLEDVQFWAQDRAR